MVDYLRITLWLITSHNICPRQFFITVECILTFKICTWNIAVYPYKVTYKLEECNNDFSPLSLMAITSKDACMRDPKLCLKNFTGSWYFTNYQLLKHKSFPWRMSDCLLAPAKRQKQNGQWLQTNGCFLLWTLKSLFVCLFCVLQGTKLVSVYEPVADICSSRLLVLNVSITWIAFFSVVSSHLQPHKNMWVAY